jgi:DNA-binding XRE family transcriptional regulator
VNQAILVLERNGPAEGRPLVDSITASRIANMKELRAQEGDGAVSDVSRWRDSGHLERAVETAGGQEAFDAAVTAMLDDARGWRLAEMRKRRGMTQEQVAVRMGVSVARVSQIESGDVSTQDVLSRFVAALGGTLKLIADFGDEQLKIA